MLYLELDEACGFKTISVKRRGGAKMYILMLWGGAEPGQRPRTRLAKLLGPASRPGYSRICVCRENGVAAYKRPRVIPDSDIVTTFRYLPSAEGLRRAKLSLSKTPTN